MVSAVLLPLFVAIPSDIPVPKLKRLVVFLA